MNHKFITAGIVLVGIILVIVPIVYLYLAHTVTYYTVANSTWTLEGTAGISYMFYAPPGSQIVIATERAGENGTYVITLKSASGKTLLQDKVEERGGWRLVLGDDKYYEIDVFNPLNTSLQGGLVARLEVDTPLAASPSATSYLVLPAIGALLVGWGVGRASSPRSIETMGENS